MNHLTKLSSGSEFGELKNYLIKDIAVIGIIDDSLRERMLREQNLTLEKTIALGQSTEQTKVDANELKQEARIYRLKFNKKENRHSQSKKKHKKTV